MAGNPRPSFTKRSKERARQEKRVEKLQKKQQRKAETAETKEETPVERTGNPVIEYDEDGQPLALDFNDF
jgi:hypothetical protein